MSLENATFPRLNTSFSVKASDVSKVLCHRAKDGREQYLIRWRTAPALPVSPGDICSWHEVTDLTNCLHLVQIYVESRQRAFKTNSTANGTIKSPSLKRKRGSRDDTVFAAPDRSLGVTTPLSRSLDGRSASVTTGVSSSDSASFELDDPDIYNGVLDRREGWIVAKRSKRADVVSINAKSLPTTEMLERAATMPVDQGEHLVRLAFEKKLSRQRMLRLENRIDGSTPSLDFKFIDDYVTGKDVYRADPESYEGCTEPCKANMGQRIGCELPRECKCLEYAAVNEDALRREDPTLHAQYQQARKNKQYIDTRDLPKRFPYRSPKGENLPQTLVSYYREERHPIYECNPNCRCGPACKSRLVQKGRRVPLTIFKTRTRGWGVYCDEDLIQGEFVDTYLGEILTNAEADLREQAGSKDKQSYLYSLDKFVDDVEDLTADTCYVVDGQYMGGPTRFINHSCEPNCRQYTVSYNKNDPRVYDIAFFAVQDIPAGTELTFDYQDKDEVEEEEAVRLREEALRDPRNAGRQRCNCGTRKCRGFLWEG